MASLSAGSFWQAAKELVYPRRCPGCGQRLDALSGTELCLCPDCVSQLWSCQKPCCQRCGEPFHPDSTDHFTCQTCQGRRFSFEFAVAAYQSRGLLRDLIHRFKYHQKLFLRPLLGELMSEVLMDSRVQELSQDACVVPVPLHHRRYREREFNQAEELARSLALHEGLQVLPALKRIRYTSSQTHYRRSQRMENLRGAFVCPPSKQAVIKNKVVFLVDDVFTTGSTAHECARILKKAGAKKVVVITLARG